LLSVTSTSARSGSTAIEQKAAGARVDIKGPGEVEATFGFVEGLCRQAQPHGALMPSRAASTTAGSEASSGPAARARRQCGQPQRGLLGGLAQAGLGNATDARFEHPAADPRERGKNQKSATPVHMRCGG
jgi:hypothetical protein